MGNVIRKYSPEQHRSGDSRDAIRSGSAFIGTLAALVLGLMVSSASKNFDVLNSGLTENAASYIDLDRVLAQYGNEANAARDLLKIGVDSEIQRIWPKDGVDIMPISFSPEMEAVAGALRVLNPADDSQKILKARAIQLLGGALQQRWQVVAQAHTYVPTAFVVIVVFWFTVLFAVFTLLSPSNKMVNLFMLFCTIAVAGGILLVLDMSQPFSGLIIVNRGPMEAALGLLGH
ncbi:MAG: DUF4239 domain-containing protein [Pseudomonadota bacterium]